MANHAWRRAVAWGGAVALAGLSCGRKAAADTSPQAVPYAQDWTNPALITAPDNWSLVPGMVAHRGDDLTTATGTDPQTILADGTATPLNVIANQGNPNTLGTGGIAEFDGLANPVVALQGSGTADAPFLLLSLNTTCMAGLNVAYNVRDVDGSTDNAVQAVALHYRVGGTGSFSNLPGGFVADATTGPSVAILVTPVSVTLPADADDQPLVQIRILTTNAVGNDEWVGVDDISVTGTVTCSTPPTGLGAANPSLVPPGATTLLTVAVTPGANPTGTSHTVAGDLSPIGGSSAQDFFDDGTSGDTTPGDNVFSYLATVDAATSLGPKTLPVTIEDDIARVGSASIALTVDLTASLVVSQVYTRGGSSGATFGNDFVEIFNHGTDPIGLDGWSIQYAPSGSGAWEVTPLGGTVPPGGYHLLRQASRGGSGLALPAPDSTGTTNLSATAGKIALVRTVTTLSGTCPSGSFVNDFVGYGTSVECFEGAGPVPPVNAANRASLRRAQGCLDNDNNAADFTTDAPTPRNSASPTVDCSLLGPPHPPTHAINQVQGNGSVSPVAGLAVTVAGLVTARRTDGFFLQTPDGSEDDDQDPTTSEGLFVFTGGTPTVSVADYAVVSGLVQEFVPGADPESPPTTEILPSAVTRVSPANPLPPPVTLSAADLPPTGTLDQLERLEGMRVHVPSLTVVGPTQGNFNETTATSTSNGVFYGVITGVPRPFREPGIPVPDALPPGAPSGIPRFDGNPERLRVDSDALVGASALNAGAGQTVSGLFGPLDYAFRTWMILPDPGTPPVVSAPLPPVAAPVPGAGQFTVASFNVRRLFDNVNDPAISEPVPTAAAFNNRLHKTSLVLREYLRNPDIVAFQEVENLPTLQTLAAKVDQDSLLAGQPAPGYVAHLQEGNDVGGIDVGLLVKASRVTVVDVTQEGKDATFVNPATGLPETLNDRPPLVLRAAIQPSAGPAFPLTVIAVHQRSLSGIDDPVDGARVRFKRRAQAEFLADLVQSRQAADPVERLVVLGDLNAFAFNDGYVDVVGTVRGLPAPATEVVLSSPDLVEPDLALLEDTIPASERYSFTFDGNAQSLDHALLSANLLGSLAGFTHVRVGADFPEVLSGSPARPERPSDHDPLVAVFNFPTATQTVLGAAPGPSTYGQPVTFTATVTVLSGGSPVTQGSVFFKEGGVVLGSASLGPRGQAVFTTTGLPAGTHEVRAEFAGAGALGISSATVLQDVAPSPVSVDLSSSPNPSRYGQPVTLSVALMAPFATPTEGTVTFSVDGVPLGSPVAPSASGTASLVLSTLTLGPHTITAMYSGTSNFNGVLSAPLPHTVLRPRRGGL
jgi:uncharacterized protein